MEPETRTIGSEDAMRALGAELLSELSPGDVVLLRGELGAGKTTLVRGLLAAAGHLGSVRSPTFNLLQVYATDPPIGHADLYRVKSALGIGLEDLRETHLLLVEWPDREGDLWREDECFRVEIAFGPEDSDARIVRIYRPS